MAFDLVQAAVLKAPQALNTARRDAVAAAGASDAER